MKSPNFKLHLGGHVPSKKNSRRFLKRGKRVFSVPSEAHEVWHEAQLWFLKGQWPANNTLHLVKSIALTFHAVDARRNDLSNKAESVMDLLVDAGILADDSWFVVPELVLHFAGVAKASAGVTIDIWL
jgi:Holliday junction resolvase RusA-like endonuclease